MMTKSRRKTLAKAINELTAGLKSDNDVEPAEAAEHVRDMLVLLLERDDFVRRVHDKK